MVARNKLVINGTLGLAREEKWSCSLHYEDPTGGAILDNPTLQTWAVNAMQKIVDLPIGDSLMSILTQSGAIDSITTYGYGATGGAVGQGQSTQQPRTGSNTIMHPPQCAMVISLLTGLPGASRRGRIYWPFLAPAVSVNLRSGQNTGVAASAATLISDLGEVEVGVLNLEPRVYSVALDVLTPVSAIRVGDVIDTQRRRRDALTETYATVDL